MITTAETGYPFGLPWNSAANFSTQVIVPFGETLVLEATSGDIHPFLATEWTTDMQKEELVLKLRDDVYFSDGSKFNAEVVEWNFVKAKEARALNPAIDRVEKRGEYEVAVIMAGGYTNMILNLLASHTFAICSKENFDVNGEYFAGENPVGTGPFLMTEKQPGAKVTYGKKNDNYWQPGKPYLDAFEFAVITDGMTQNAAMLSKGNDKVDVLNNPPSPEQLAVLDADSDLTVWAFPNGINCIWTSSINEDSPFNKQDVREAVSYAVDRELIAAARGYGYQKPATQFIPKGFYGHYNDERNMFEYNPAKAKELLAAAGQSEELIHAVCCHGWGLTAAPEKPEHLMEKVLFAVDELTGLIWAAAIIRPSRSVMDMELKSVKKKFKTAAFAAGCNREVIQKGAAELGWDLDKLIDKTIQAMRSCEAEINAFMAAYSPQS
ncbi:MAG: ABC transporter substrate-binding protein [Spirochaetaceae bacterium]|nr:ABC transporter substrate-binding protein [Spirochaetaceae bacterium]